MKSHPTLADRWPFWRCVRWGFYIGLAYSILAVVTYSGIQDFRAYYGISLLLVVAIDIGGATAGGLVVGALLRWIRGPIGYIITAALALAPAYVLFAISARKVPNQSAIDGVLAALVVGSFLGVAVWLRERSQHRKR